MKKFEIFIVLFISLVLIVSIALSQIILRPGTTEFTLQPIILEPPPREDGDYPGNPDYPKTLLTPRSPLALLGDVDYLMIKWNARWADNSDRNIGVRCYLNCPDTGSNIDSNCASYQKCEYLGPPGLHSCIIREPRYLFKVLNNVTCKFYDPASPGIEFLPYPQRSFWIIDYKVFIPSKLVMSVGDKYTFKVNIMNLGLLPSSFFVNITDVQNPLNFIPVVIEGAQSTSEKVSSGKTAFTQAELLFLSTGNLVLLTDVKSTIEPTQTFSTACTLASDCPPTILKDSDDLCFQNRCWQRFSTEITIGLKSLSEFGLMESIFIIITSILFFFVFVLKYKNQKIIRN